jgi:2,3-bisphosphoglycerate-independent phosphoglycerate mutase
MSVIFVFVDGVGLAPEGPDNPLSDAPTPALRALLGGPLTLEQATGLRPASAAPSAPLLLAAIDATLGLPGLPQSGTGQTALFGGFNAAALHGRHQPHFPPVALRGRLAEQSVLRRAQDRGLRPAFANAFGDGYWEAVAARRIRRSASVIAAEGAGVRFRDEADLLAGHAVSWDITGAAQRQRGVDAPPVPPATAGERLARLAHRHELVLFETFLPDLAGHGRLLQEPADHRPPTADDAAEQAGARGATGASAAIRPWSPKEQIHTAMERIDGLLGGLLAAMRPEDTLLVTSDHGNVESLAAPAHTRNPVPLLAAGSGASIFSAVTDISEVADAILAALHRSSA